MVSSWMTVWRALLRLFHSAETLLKTLHILWCVRPWNRWGFHSDVFSVWIPFTDMYVISGLEGDRPRTVTHTKMQQTQRLGLSLCYWSSQESLSDDDTWHNIALHNKTFREKLMWNWAEPWIRQESVGQPLLCICTPLDLNWWLTVILWSQ